MRNVRLKLIGHTTIRKMKTMKKWKQKINFVNRAKKKIPFRNPRQQLEHPKKFFLQKFKDSFEFSLSFFKKIIFFWYFSFKILLIRDKTSLVLTPKLSQWLIEAIGCRWRGNPVGCHLFKFIPLKHSMIFNYSTFVFDNWQRGCLSGLRSFKFILQG